ncbi:glycoside hydrolase family 31 protein [Sporolactobacillus vineae]|uniref:glycoside hydrolase family 31 protein n=1 Tax=Sporolactobacillus vineae TaxID=444463 RepID=UPI00028818E9|nr:glycoside hydrolase family 31 protein [Sporolactobacillus vineae]
MFGKLKGFQQQGSSVTIRFEQKAATVDIITPGIVRFFVPFTAKQQPSKAIEQLQKTPGSFTVRSGNGEAVIETEKLTVRIGDDFRTTVLDKDGRVLSEDDPGTAAPFIRRGAGEGLELAAAEGHKLEAERNKLKFQVRKKMEHDMFFYGLGEKTGHLNKKGYHYKMWNTDDPSPHVESFETLYKSIPFFIALKDRQAFGYFLDNTYESVFDLGKENSNYYAFGAVDGNLDYYFIYGPSAKEVVGGYTHLTGTAPLPQLWTLGYQQCRWAYVPEQRLREVAETFRRKDIPCDALYLDIDYMDGYRVFTWDKKKFPDPHKTLQDLREQGFKVVTIIDPGVKKDKGYPIYDQGMAGHYFATDKDGLPYVNKVWPGDALYPDFSSHKVRSWWAANQKIMTDTGVSGIWNDMNEPASFNGPLPDDVQFQHDGVPADHREIHNVYGHYMAKATYEGLKKATGKRPFVITRACYAGTQKYSTVWTGDNQSLWEHLRMSLPMLMNLGLSGVPFCGTDVGGFGFDCTAELLARWIQVGAFTPLFRNHSSIYTRDQEPWAFGEQTEAICRKYIKLRYRLLPYLYDLFHQEEKNGLPLIRPLLLNDQHDPRTYEINDEFLCGDDLLVAPVVTQGEKARAVYLPEGSDWVDYWTKTVYKGGQYIIRETPLDVCPIYIRSGAVIPLYPVQHYVGEQPVTELTLDVYPARKGIRSYRHYQDDGESFAYRKGAFNLYQFDVTAGGDGKTIRISAEKKHAGYEKGYRSFRFIVNQIHPAAITLEGEPVAFSDSGNQTVFTVKKTGEVTIQL